MSHVEKENGAKKNRNSLERCVMLDSSPNNNQGKHYIQGNPPKERFKRITNESIVSKKIRQRNITKKKA